MKIRTSYFYQIRFFPSNYIPVSTVLFDPAWFHQNRGPQYVWKDKNGVYNGIRNELMHPGPMCDGLCGGPSQCAKVVDDCAFKRAYRNQLNHIDFKQFMINLSALVDRIDEKENFTEEPVVVFIVYEAPDNPCSERQIIINWFNDNGIDCKELDYPIK